MTASIPFTKMHGAGNDYLYVDAVADPSLTRLLDDAAYPSFVRRVCDRHFGIGADGVFVIDHDSAGRFRVTIHNADGTAGDLCGNGLRCAVRLLHDRGHTTAADFTVVTATRDVNVALLGRGGVRLDMGVVCTDLDALPIDRVHVEAIESVRDARVVAVAGVRGVLVGVGNPHLVVMTDAEPTESGIFSAPGGAPGFGPALESHPAFPERVNVHAVRCVSRSVLSVANYERGSGRTLACGTGACAAAWALRLLDQAGTDVRVMMEGGELIVSTDDAGRASLSGPTESVCEGVTRFP